MMFTYKGRIIELTEDGSYRPNTIIVDGVLYSMEKHASEKEWNWKASSQGNDLYYMSDDGSIFSIPQKVLNNDFARELYSLYKASGKSQRTFAEALGVPLRSFEDWITFKRVPASYNRKAILESARSIQAEISPAQMAYAVSLMDDDIREAVHADLAPCADSAFLAEYCKRHLDKYGEEFVF